MQLQLVFVLKLLLMQVSSNAWELRGELASAYMLEQLTEGRRKAGLEAPPVEDDPDSWVETPYAMFKPCDISGPDDPRYKGTWQRPWADEMLVTCSPPSCLFFHSQDVDKAAQDATTDMYGAHCHSCVVQDAFSIGYMMFQ